MPLIVLQPPTLKPEIGTRPALQCYFSFNDIGDALVGASARLIVYDSDLYAASDLGISEGADFAGFRENAKTLTSAQRSPAFGAGTGVLLKADCKIGKTPGGSWILKGIDKNASINPNANADRIQLVLQVRDKAEAAVSFMAYDVRDPSVAGIRELLVRLVLVEPAAGLPAGAVLASNLNSQHTATPGPIRFILDAREGRANAEIGATAAASDIHFAKPSADPSRIFKPDLTGFYDSIPLVDGENSALLLQVNQAGRALVGWFTPPPAHIKNTSRILGVLVPSGQNQVLLGAGVLVAHLDERTPSGGFLMKWMAASATPDSAFNTLDPDDVNFAPNTSRVHVGELRIVQPSDATLPPQILLKFDSVASDLTSFRLTKLGPRWSANVIDFMPAALRDRTLVEMVRPVPISEWQSVRNIFAPTRIPSLEKLLNNWDTAINDASKIAARDLVAQCIDIRQIPNPYRAAYASRLRAFASSNTMAQTAKKNRPDTFMAMLQRVIAEEQDSLRRPGGKLAPSTIKDIFDAAGIQPQGEFVYQIVLTKQTGADIALIAKFGGWAFTMSVSGFQMLDDKVELPFEKRQKATLFDSEKNGVKFDGIFGETGIGLGVSLALGIPGLKAEGGSALIGGATFQTFARLNPQDFASATFAITATKAPNASFGFGVSVSVESGSSAFIELCLTNGVVLSTVVEKSGITFDGPAPPASFDELGHFVGSIYSPEVEVSLGAWAWGFGLLTNNRATDLIPKLITPPLLDAPLRLDEVHVAHRESPSFFAVDSFVIDEHLKDDSKKGGQSVRLGLEEFLAIDRAMLDSIEGRVHAFGLASPEHNEVHNQILSENRAEAVIQAVKDALGPALFNTELRATGLGESLATSKDFNHGGGGLLDPPDDPSGRSRFLREHPDQKPNWPSWRRVDLVVENVLIARLRTEP